VLLQWSQNPQADLKRALGFAQKALALDDSDLSALITVAWDDVLEFRPEQAVADAERAVELNPNYAGSYDLLGVALTYDGKPEEAIPQIERAIRLDPMSETYYMMDIGLADLFLRRYPEAAQMAERHLAAYPNDIGALVVRCIAYSELGRERDARAQAAEIMRLNPEYKFIIPDRWVPLLMPLRHFGTDVRKAGLKLCTSNLLRANCRS
jgi:adenylate cyclase